MVISGAERYWFVDDETRAAARPLPGDFNDFAWDRADALRVIEEASQKAVAILGGDVWESHGSGANLAVTYDNWSCDRRDGEGEVAYAQRSCEEARRFIETFDSTREYAFVVVPKATATP